MTDSLLGKIAYGASFCIGLPLLLWAWATRLDRLLPGLPSFEAGYSGVVMLCGGIALMATGMLSLWRRGGGLPMNAFPPPRLVRLGLYDWLAHPIYLGSALALAGGFLLGNLEAGIWIVLPCFVAGIFALLHGYEVPELKRRFRERYRSPCLCLPEDSRALPEPGHRLAALLLVLLPWAIGYEYLAVLLPETSPRQTFMPFELRWPVLEWTVVPYLFTYVLIVATPLLVTTRRDLRDFMVAGWIGTLLGLACFALFPLTAPPRPFVPQGALGDWLELQRMLDTPACAFPSFHVFWALLAAWVLRPRLSSFVAWSLAILLCASCVTTGMHSLLDVVSGFALFVLACRHHLIYRWTLSCCEGIANSWREWRVGRVRIINHGLYVGIASAVGLYLAGALLPHATPWQVFSIGLAGLAGACAWGQWLEASSKLMRPFGYYGGLFGGMAGLLLFGGAAFWPFFAAFACVAPVVQAIGRLRCLVQGCCHGRPCDVRHGIRYRREPSRVVRIAGWHDVPLYPTPLYSIAGNLVLAMVLYPLARYDAPASLIAGLYLFLSACLRFVEEQFRGEPQTPFVVGLSLYQLLALGCGFGGIALSMFPSPDFNGDPVWRPDMIKPALLLGVLSMLGMGADLPESSKPMSRLA